jgi:8-oxo-dGTP pyrophosphatase MutT (NUDIX family)
MTIAYMSGEELSDRVRQALSDYNPKRIENPTAAAAAVLILINHREGVPHLVFTERTHEVEHHKGQICFPGGACDDIDIDCEETALRETFEEIGVRVEHVKVVGHLDDMVTISNFRVTPVVAFLEHESEYPYCINDREVSQVVEVPLQFLMEEGNMELEVREHQGREVLVPAFTYDGHRIWGATARMLHQLVELLR